MTKPLRAIARLHALTGSKLDEQRPVRGETLRDFMDRAGFNTGLRSIIAERVDGKFQPIMRANWDRRITTRMHIVVYSAPGGGGGGGGGGSKSVASIVGLVALVALATVVAGPAGAALASSLGVAAGAATSVVSSLIIGGGSLLLSHFLGGSQRPKQLAPEYSINITSNQARSQQPIPAQYGKVKFFPDLAAPSFSDYSGTDQIFHALLSLGVGLYELHEIGIGTQAMWRQGTGNLAGFPNLKIEQVNPNVDCVLFPTNVAVSSEVSGQSLPDPYGTKYTDGTYAVAPNGDGAGGQHGGPHNLGPFIVNQPQTVATSFQVDLIWSGGLYYTSPNNGEQRTTSCRIQCYYYYVDDQGQQLGNPVQAWSDEFSANTKNPYRITRNFDLPTPGRVAVQIGRLDKQGRTGITDSVVWAGLRAYLKGSQQVPYASRVAVQMVADAQFSAYSSSQIYVIATRMIPVFNGSAFVLQSSRNPYWAALDVWNNPDYGGNLPYSSVDLASFYARAQQADTLGLHFDYRFTAQTTLLSAIEICLRPALATGIYVFGNMSVMRDEARTFPTLEITDHEIVRGTLEIAYTLKDEQTSDGVIVQYIDNTTWQKAEVSSRAPGVILQMPTRLAPEGFTDRAVATDYARYMALSNNYRRKTVMLETESDARLLRRGVQVIVQSELPQTWGLALRVVNSDIGNRIIQTDLNADWSVTGNHYIRLRTRAGAPFGPIKVARTSQDNLMQLDATDLATVQTQQGLTLAQVLARSDGEVVPSLEFGVGTPSSFVGLVKSINRGSMEGTFKVELINDALQVYSRGQPVDPLPTITGIIGQKYPDVIKGIRAYMAQSDVAMVMHASWQPDPASVSYVAQVSYDAGTSFGSLYVGPLPAFDVVCAPSDCVVRILGVSLSGAHGPWTQIAVAGVSITYQAANLGYAVNFDDLAEDLRRSVEFQPLQSLDDLISIDALNKAAGISPTGSTVILTPLAQTVTLLDNALTQETYARVSNDTALVGYAFGVKAVVDQNQASVLQQFEVQAGINTSTATSITTLTAGVGTNAAAIVQEATTRANADSATAAVITTLTASVNTNTAAISTELITRANADSAIAASVTSLATTVNGNTAAITIEAQTRSTADAAISTTLTALSSTVSGNSASITAEAQTRADADSALSTQVTSLASTVAGNTAAITTEAQTRATADSATATTISGLTASVNGNSASITTEAQARATQDSAIIAYADSINSTVGGHTASISTLASATNGYAVQYGVVGTIDGVTGGFIFSGVKRLDGSVYYNMTIRGDVVVDGTFSATKIIDLSIPSGKIAPNAVTNIAFAQKTNNDDNIQVTFSVDTACPVLIEASFVLSWVLPSSINAGAQYTFTLQFYIDGNHFFDSVVAQPNTGTASIRLAGRARADVSSTGSHTAYCYCYITGSGGDQAAASRAEISITALKK